MLINRIRVNLLAKKTKSCYILDFVSFRDIIYQYIYIYNKWLQLSNTEKVNKTVRKKKDYRQKKKDSSFVILIIRLIVERKCLSFAHSCPDLLLSSQSL